MLLTKEQCIWIIMQMYRMQNAKMVVLEFKKHYKVNEDIPSENFVGNIFRNFLESGTVVTEENSSNGNSNNKTVSRRSSIVSVSEDNKKYSLSIYEAVTKDGTVSPYFLRINHILTPEDCDIRLQMCEDLTQLISADKSFVDNIFFSSEASFHTDGRVSKHNCTIWGSDYPLERNMRDCAQVKVWCGIAKDQIYGPFFFDAQVITDEEYVNMLRTFLIPLLKKRNRFAHVIFQHDGGASHLGRKVRHFLDEKFPERWLGRRGLVQWAPRAPDLSPIDFYFWGEIKSQVYKVKPKSLADLRNRITTAMTAIRMNSMQDSLVSWQRRITQCIENNGELVND